MFGVSFNFFKNIRTLLIESPITPTLITPQRPGQLQLLLLRSCTLLSDYSPISPFSNEYGRQWVFRVVCPFTIGKKLVCISLVALKWPKASFFVEKHNDYDHHHVCRSLLLIDAFV